MKKNTATITVLALLAILLASGTPLHADSKPLPKKGAEQVDSKVPTNQVQTDNQLQPGNRLQTGNRMQFPRPVIREFSCESLTDGYNLMLFGGPPGCADCRINVIFDIFARGGLSKFEIRFRDNLVHEENFLGPPVSSRSCRVLRLDLSPYDPPRSGYYDLVAKLVDRLGQSVTRSVRLRVDLERPTITSIVPNNGEIVYADIESATITFEITARDDFSGVKAVWMGGLAGSMTDNTAPFRITFNNVRVGEAGFDIQVLDNEGNVRSDYTSVSVRRRPAVRRIGD